MFSNINLTATCALLAGLVAFGSTSAVADTYNPVIDPAHFTTKIDNPFFSMPIGKKMIFEKRTDEGLERIEITITGEKRTIMGVDTFVYLDREFLNGELVEETKDYIAQDKDGNVWYCGEISENFEEFDGDETAEPELVDIDGSWKAGRDGSEAGILLPFDPQVGDVFRQELAPTDAEDAIEILSVDASEAVAGGSCEGTCLMTRDFTPLEPGAEENKFYVPGTGLIVEVDLESGDRVELVSFMGVGQ